MGTENSSNDEWIELYNNNNNSVNLSGWILKTSDEGINFSLKGYIKPKDYFLLERTDDSSVESIQADQVYTGGLNNSGEKLELIFNNTVIDSIDCSLGWIAGNNETHQTMERIDSSISSTNNWQTSEKSGGTPKQENSQGETIKEQKEINYTKASLKDVNLSSFLIALIIAILSSIMLLIIKRSIKK